MSQLALFTERKMTDKGRPSGMVDQRPQTQVFTGKISYKSANGNGTLRKHTIYVVFYSRGFHDVPRVLIADARSFQALAAILDYVTYLASMSCWYRADARQAALFMW